MGFVSILFPNGPIEELSPQTPLFKDLDLEPIFDAICQERPAYDLGEFYRMPLRQAEAVHYRQPVMRDVAGGGVEALEAFAAAMQAVQQLLAEAAHESDQNTAACRRLQAISAYTAAASELQAVLSVSVLHSAGLQLFRDALADYCQQPVFANMQQEAGELSQMLADIHYTLCIAGSSIDVSRYAQEQDLDPMVSATFARFVQQPLHQNRVRPLAGKRLNHVEEAIVGQLAVLYPEVFQRLYEFCGQPLDFMPAWLLHFQREIEFYLAFYHYMQGMKERGVGFCYPVVSDTVKEFFCVDGSDLALVQQLAEGKTAVKNSFSLQGKERSIVVTGPNQGGKTTFARMIGQLAYFASLGLPVAAVQAQVFLPECIFTHFERQEQEVSASGKLQDDIVRIHEILQQATAGSLLIINEMFASTTLRDAIGLGRAVMQQVSAADMFCIYVTFLEELSAFDDKTISMVSEVAADGETRTYKIRRHPADGKAYALSVAERYHLRQEDVRRRLQDAGPSII